MNAYPRIPLGEVCTINPRIKRSGIPEEDTLVSFVPMAAVDERFGMIMAREDRRLGDVSKGFTAFEDGDILFAKITPCMENGKAALARNLTNGIGRGSTEFYVLRPGGEVLGEYVYHFVRQPRFREKAKRHFTGTAGQQRVPKSFMEDVPIPLPPLDAQRRIVCILNRTARIENLCARVDKYLRDFVPALFAKMFGDPIENPMGWERRRLGDMSEVQGGLQVTRKRANHPLKKPYLRVANVLRDRLVLSEIKCIRLTDNELDRVRLQRNDLLIVEGHGNPGEIGRAAIWDGSVKDCVHQNHLIRVRPDRASLIPEFACAYLNSISGRQHLLRSGKTTSGLNTISTSDVKACTLFVPPLDLQNRFAEVVAAARDIAATTESSLDTASALSASLMTRLLGDGA